MGRGEESEKEMHTTPLLFKNIYIIDKAWLMQGGTTAHQILHIKSAKRPTRSRKEIGSSIKISLPKDPKHAGARQLREAIKRQRQ